jgi:uncharacterized membrane protein YhiD involved in acid resistance
MNMHEEFAGIEIQTWIEMGVGLFVEGLLLTLIFFWISQRASKKSDKSLQNHLKDEDKTMYSIKNQLMNYHAEVLEQMLHMQRIYEEQAEQQQNMEAAEAARIYRADVKQEVERMQQNIRAAEAEQKKSINRSEE